MDKLHALSVKLKKAELGPAQARLGMVFAGRLLRLGVDMAKLEGWLEFCEQVSPNPPEGFWESATEFHNLTMEAGKGYHERLPALAGCIPSCSASLPVHYPGRGVGPKSYRAAAK